MLVLGNQFATTLLDAQWRKQHVHDDILLRVGRIQCAQQLLLQLALIVDSEYSTWRDADRSIGNLVRRLVSIRCKKRIAVRWEQGFDVLQAGDFKLFWLLNNDLSVKKEQLRTFRADIQLMKSY